MDNPKPALHASLSPAQVLAAIKRQTAHDRRTKAIITGAAHLPMPKGGAIISQEGKRDPAAQKLIARLWAETDRHCVYCNRQSPPSSWSRDHLLPKCMGGPNAAWNYVPACRRCNSERGVKLPAFKIAAEPWKEYVRAKELAIVLRTKSKAIAWLHQIEQWEKALTQPTTPKP